MSGLFGRCVELKSRLKPICVPLEHELYVSPEFDFLTGSAEVGFRLRERKGGWLDQYVIQRHNMAGNDT